MELKPKFHIANQKDVEQIYEVMKDTEYVDFFYKRQSKKEVILKLIETFFEKDKCVTIVVCEIDNKIFGYSIFEPYAFFAQQKPDFPKETENYAYSLGTGILRKFRGKGRGTALRLFADSEAKKQGYKGMYTDVDSTNRGSLKVQKNAGFDKIAEIDNKQRFIFKKTF